ncbi:hypothetical protein AB0M39_06880 [Streptomyces sp. NPDC051907]|uniref:hypothetical protein n=1 Tax=Streptomyces sp. NPDC051907 TaxID=3155284 RepID=UPI0034494CB6
MSAVGRGAGAVTGVTATPSGRTGGIVGRAERCTVVAAPPLPADSAGATGSDSVGSSSPEAGGADEVSTPWTSPPGASSRTAWDSGPAKAGLCQVVSRLPKPPSETGAVVPAVTRWIGGSADQPAGRTPPGSAAPNAEPAAVPVLGVPSSERPAADTDASAVATTEDVPPVSRP